MKINRFTFEQLSINIQKVIKDNYKDCNTLDGLLWQWYDIDGNVIGDMLPY